MRDLIDYLPGFQYSVNIGYDLGNDAKLQGFIPTKSSLTLLEDILLSINPASTDRARVLIGAYGKGKSHIVLTILSLLMKRDLALFQRLLPKVEENSHLNHLLQHYYESNDRLLPVVITGSNTSLTQAFLLALQRALSDFNLIDAMPKTNYQAAVRVIHRWKTEYPDTYRLFSGMVDEPIERFTERLESFDVKAYETFETAYPELTAGSVFNPFLGFDVAELYEDVAESLKAKGYSGLYVVYDEFSKFLEANIVSASVSDTKMLQDFAEKCTRSGNLQLHIMLISHKEISNYIDKLPKDKTDGWRGVSERFKHIHINNNFSQTYEIISSVITHREPAWERFCRLHNPEFTGLRDRYHRHQMFVDAAEELDTVLYGCFPLHPVSTFVLPRLSEKVAQNERTLFTFLSADGISTLPAFLNEYQNDFSLLTPDRIYDYFEPLLKKEVYAGGIHDTFVLTSDILRQLDEGSLGSKIIKTISLIYMLEQFERLSPTKEQIIGTFSWSYRIEDIEAAIDDLIEKQFILYLSRSNDYLRLKQTSGVDIRQRISDLMEKQKGKIATKDVLNQVNIDQYMYPSRYNDQREMTRYFSFCFIAGDEITEDVNWTIKSEQIQADGIIYGVIPDSEEQLAAVTKMIQKTSEGQHRFIFVLPKHYRMIDSIVREYAATKELQRQAQADPVLFEEYEVVLNDLEIVVRDFVSGYTHPERFLANYYHNGNAAPVHRKSALTSLMSNICDEVFSLTPVINNEAVNKSIITGIAQTSRNKIVAALLRGPLEPNLGFVGRGQEVSIMRSTLLRTGIWSEAGGIPEINLRPEDAAMRNLLEVIEGFILEARGQGEKNFSELYQKLTSPEYHIGLRQGVIPIYLAAVMHHYRQQTVIHDSFGPIPTSVDALIQINAEPASFSLEYLDWDEDKEEYVERLAEAFAQYIIPAERAGNSYDYVANAMRRWFMALPKYTKECKMRPGGTRITRRNQEMLRILRQNTSGSDLLFRKLPQVFAYQTFDADAAEAVSDAKKKYDGLLDDLKQFLIELTKKMFLPKEDHDRGERMTLTAVLHEWSDSLDQKSFEQLFPDGTDRFLKHVQTATNDEELFITRLAKIATGLRIEDWDGKTVERFRDAIRQYKDTAEAFHSSVVEETINDTAAYQIVFADEEGTGTTRRFERVEMSPRGKMLFRQITSNLEAMGQSISEQEKRQVLMEVLKKLC